MSTLNNLRAGLTLNHAAGILLGLALLALAAYLTVVLLPILAAGLSAAAVGYGVLIAVIGLVGARVAWVTLHDAHTEGWLIGRPAWYGQKRDRMYRILADERRQIQTMSVAELSGYIDQLKPPLQNFSRYALYSDIFINVGKKDSRLIEVTESELRELIEFAETRLTELKKAEEEEAKKAPRIAFLMGSKDPESAVSQFMADPLFDPKLLQEIFVMSGDLKMSDKQREQQEIEETEALVIRVSATVKKSEAQLAELSGSVQTRQEQLDDIQEKRTKIQGYPDNVKLTDGSLLTSEVRQRELQKLDALEKDVKASLDEANVLKAEIATETLPEARALLAHLEQAVESAKAKARDGEVQRAAAKAEKKASHPADNVQHQQQQAQPKASVQQWQRDNVKANANQTADEADPVISHGAGRPNARSSTT